MSFVRFGEGGSQVYIYEEAGDTKVCHLCAFTSGTEDFFRTNDLDAMLAHVTEHRAAGHAVPEWVETVLADEWVETETEQRTQP